MSTQLLCGIVASTSGAFIRHSSRRQLSRSVTVAAVGMAKNEKQVHRPVDGRRNGENHKRVATKQPKTLEDLVVPVRVDFDKNADLKSTADEPLTPLVSFDGTALDKNDIAMILVEFFRRKEMHELAREHNVHSKMFTETYRSFRLRCLAMDQIEPELAVVLGDILAKNGHVDELFPYFLAHAKRVFPHLECAEDLRKISNMTEPHLWYPEARDMHRKIVFHAGPTNSGKTYHALKRLFESESGVYCGPLKLLANEVYFRANGQGVKCDLVTGDERRFAIDNKTPSPHLSCTVEMLSTSMPVDVAVIDEIQMVRDTQRGWAWTRALLGAAAKEVHLCGEPAAIEVVRKTLERVGEVLEVRRYDRMSPLEIMDKAVVGYDKVQKGDCVVCFSRHGIYTVSNSLERLGVKTAVIYGDLPPSTKLAQAARFNDPNDPVNVLVATDAIGMGLNLNIRRVIFKGVKKMSQNNEGKLVLAAISNYAALQIAGRAGRYGTEYEKGMVTTMDEKDLFQLKKILAEPVTPIETMGVAPTFEQLEMFAYHLPQATLTNLLDIFETLCTLDDSMYFMCNIDNVKKLAKLLEHMDMQLKPRYTFCLAPISVEQNPLGEVSFVKFARKFSSNEPLTFQWLCSILEWPQEEPQTLIQLVKLEQMYEVLEVYLWLGLRFEDMFPHMVYVREMQETLDQLIQSGLENINELIRREGVKVADDSKDKTGPAEDGDGVWSKSTGDIIQLARGRLAGGKAAPAPVTLPGKRQGKRKSVLTSAVASGSLSVDQLEKIRAEVRQEILAEKERQERVDSTLGTNSKDASATGASSDSEPR